MKKQIKRGSIFLYDFGQSGGSEQGGYRPVLVVQNNSITKNSPEVLVSPITGKIKKPFYFPHVYLGQRFGLEVPSMVLCEQITTVGKEKLQHYIGTVDDPKTKRIIDETVEKVLGIQSRKSKPPYDLRCLCSFHREEYFLTNKYIVKRLDPLQTVKEKCDKCGRYGYDYLLVDKRLVQCKGGNRYEK